MSKRLGLAVLVGILGAGLFTSGASAATYYIAPTGGSDTSGSGKLTQPFATFTYAIGQTQPGDTLFHRVAVPVGWARGFAVPLSRSPYARRRQKYDSRPTISMPKKGKNGGFGDGLKVSV